MIKPILCNYYITYRCNARCQFCDIWQNARYRSIADCSINDVNTNLSQLKKIGIKFIDFTGGEPLLHKDLPAMLTYAKQLRFYTSVTTNCLLYPNLAEKLRGKVDWLHFSIDSMDSKENDALRGRSTFDTVMKSIRIALDLGEKPDLLYTVTKSNYHAIEKLSKFAAQKKLILIVNPLFQYSTQELLSADILSYLEKFQFEPYVYLNHAFHRLIKKGGNDPLRPRCRAVTATIVISPENDLLLPCFHQAKYKIPIEANLIDIVRSNQYRQVKQKQGRFSFCRNCTINCYFDPSFLYRIDSYFWLSLISKAKYGFDKYVMKIIQKSNIKMENVVAPD